MQIADRLIFTATLILMALISVIDGARNPILYLFFSSVFLGLGSVWLIFCFRSFGGHLANYPKLVLWGVLVLWLLVTWLQYRALIGFDSINPYSSLKAFYLYSGYCAAFALLIALLRTPARIFWLAGVCVGVGIAQTIFGVINYYSGEAVFGWAPTHYAFSRVTGSYINRNFYANLVVMVMGFPIVWMLVSNRGSELEGYAYPHRRNGEFVLALIIFAILFSGLLLSGSRAASASFVGASAFLIILVLLNKRLAIQRIWLFFACLLGLVIAGIGLLNQRFAQILTDASDRIEQWKLTLDLALGSIITGYGAGSYENVFRSRSMGELSPMTYNHAHNDYLELVIEQGILGLLIVSTMVFYVLWISLKKIYSSRSLKRKKLILSGVFGICAICLHAIVDSPFQVPANTWNFIALLSIVLSSADVGFSDQAKTQNGQILSR